MIVLALCRKDNLCKELWGYARAFERQGVVLHCLDWGTPVNVDVREPLRQCRERPNFILNPESGVTFMPTNLTEVDVPTVCFHFDTYQATARRIRWSMIYDIPVVFHPHFEEEYRRAGHPNPMTLAHAAPIDLYSARNLEEHERHYEVGWVGRLNGAPYDARRRILPGLANQFRMNDWEHAYTTEETAEIYRQSKIIVNISRDDYPQDANMRVYEAMAAGALLMTRTPSDLSMLGFVEGEHFIGYRDETEIVPMVRRWLADEVGRARITSAARDLVLARHTYDARVKALLECIAANASNLSAPARRWPESKVRLAYLDYYAGTSSMDCAYNEFRWIARHSLTDSVEGARLLARGWGKQVLYIVKMWAQGRRATVAKSGRSMQANITLGQPK
jgi:glycosyl transferase family 1